MWKNCHDYFPLNQSFLTRFLKSNLLIITLFTPKDISAVINVHGNWLYSKHPLPNICHKKTYTRTLCWSANEWELIRWPVIMFTEKASLYFSSKCFFFFWGLGGGWFKCMLMMLFQHSSCFQWHSLHLGGVWDAIDYLSRLTNIWFSFH